MPRPTDAELVALIRDAIYDITKGVDESYYRLVAAADALEAANAEPFEAKVERAAAAIWEAAERPMSGPFSRDDYAGLRELNKGSLRIKARAALRAAGVEG